MPDDKSKYDCVTCGACCYLESRTARYTPVTDEADMRRIPTRMLAFNRTARELSMKSVTIKPGRHRCIAIRGRLGQHVECQIYNIRPRACHEYPPGGERCRAARKRYNID